MDNEKVMTLANDISNIALNKVLAKDINIHEAMTAVIQSVAYIMGKSMSEDMFNQKLNEALPLTTSIVSNLKTIIDNRELENKPVQAAELLLAMNTAIDYILDHIE